MKKLLTMLFCLLAASSFAQEGQLGLRLGMNVASVTDIDMGAKVGLAAGLVYKAQVNDQFAIQPELYFSSQGTAEKLTEGGFELSIKSPMYYFNIPVLAKFYPADGFYIQGGPQLGLNLYAKDIYKLDGEEVERTDFKDDVKVLDFALALGMGYEFSEQFFIDARYNIGLTDFAEGNTSDYKFTHQVFQLSFGVFF